MCHSNRGGHLLVVGLGPGLKGGYDSLLNEAVQLLEAGDDTAGAEGLQPHAPVALTSVELAPERLKHLAGRRQLGFAHFADARVCMLAVWDCMLIQRQRHVQEHRTDGLVGAVAG